MSKDASVLLDKFWENLGNILSILIQIYQLGKIYKGKFKKLGHLQRRSAVLDFSKDSLKQDETGSILKVAKLNEGCEFATACGIGHILMVTHK